MSLVPAFDIGIWNAWIFMALLFLSTILVQMMMKKEAQSKFNAGWASKKWSKAGRISALLTHIIILPITLIYSIFLPLKTGTAWFYVGLVICLIALSIYYMAGFNIAKTQTVNEPVTKGIYRFSRHPLYLGGFLLFLGIGIACASWLFILFALVWIILWFIAVPSEENDVSEKYGDAYRKYMNRTPRWIGIPKPETK
jgi:protein-S-isoprenylcysteine O-methyltransferase Ste14